MHCRVYISAASPTVLKIMISKNIGWAYALRSQNSDQIFIGRVMYPGFS